MTTITDTLTCEVCGKGPFKDNRGVAAHTRIKHPDDTVDPVDTVTDSDDTEDLRAQLHEALQRAEAAEAEAAEYKPTRDVSSFFMDSEKDVVARYGNQKLEDIALGKLGVINRQRAKENLPPIQFATEAERQREIDNVVTQLLADRRAEGPPPPPSPIPKSLKMLKPDGSLVQLPYESQINNLAGSLEDAVARYRNKGYKLAVDSEGRTLCPAQNCWEVAVVEGGKNTFGGYCSADHQARTEGNTRPIDRGVYTRR